VQEDGSTALVEACERGDTDIVTLLLAVPGVDVNAAKVSCVSGRRLHAVISHRHVCSLRARGVASWLGARQFRAWMWITWAAGCGWRCCVQEDGSTALMAVCSNGHTDIVTLLLAVPGVDVNAAKVSCVSGKRLHAVISHCYIRCEPEVWLDGSVWGRVSVEVDCVGGGL
jgi:ankyrin repeat protein